MAYSLQPGLNNKLYILNDFDKAPAKGILKQLNTPEGCPAAYDAGYDYTTVLALVKRLNNNPKAQIEQRQDGLYINWGNYHFIKVVEYPLLTKSCVIASPGVTATAPPPGLTVTVSSPSATTVSADQGGGGTTSCVSLKVCMKCGLPIGNMSNNWGNCSCQCGKTGMSLGGSPPLTPYDPNLGFPAPGFTESDPSKIPWYFPIQTPVIEPYKLPVGWICPVCGSGMSPNVSKCSCKGTKDAYKL